MGGRPALKPPRRRRLSRASLVAAAVLAVVATLTTTRAALGATEQAPSASAEISDSPIWNVQAFLPDIASYQRQGYSIAAPTCTGSGSARHCTTSSATTTSVDTTSATNSAPVASLVSISCAGGTSDLVTCMALGSSPSGTPVLVTTDNSGLDWRFDDLPTKKTVATSLSCPAAGVCYLAGEAANEPAVFATHDGGRNWTRIAIAGSSRFTGTKLVSISCATEMICITSGGLVTNTASGSLLAQTPLLLEMHDPSAGFVLPSYKSMGPFCCQGSRWNGAGQPGLPSGVGSVSCGTPTFCIAIGGTDSNLGFIEGRSEDGGLTWTSVSSHFVLPAGAHGLIGVAPALVRCSGADNCELGYAVDYGLGGATPYTIFRSHDGGTDWTYDPTPTSVGSVSDFGCSTANVCFAAGNGIASTVDGGSTWSTSVSQSSMNAEGVTTVADMSCVPGGGCWAVGSGGTGAYILDTVSGEPSASRLAVCAGSRLPEIGDPCRPAFAMSGLSVAPSCWSGDAAPNTGQHPSSSPQPAPIRSSSERLEGESATLAGGASTGAWATLSVPPMCRDASGVPASSSLVLQDLDGSAFFQVGIRYQAATPDDPNGSDEIFTELEDGGAGAHPGSYGFAGSSTASHPVPFTDVTWLEPLATTELQVGLTETHVSVGGSEYSVDLYAPQPPVTGSAAAPPPTTFPFSGPAEFVFSCGAGGLGPTGSCAQGEKGSPGPLDTVDLANEVGSSSAPMPGSCADPLTFSDVQIDRGSWVSLPQLPGVATSGTSYSYDEALGAWVLSAKDVSGLVPALSQAELYAQDGSGSAGAEPAGAWQTQNNSTSTATGVSMSDQPCDTWAGVPAG